MLPLSVKLELASLYFLPVIRLLADAKSVFKAEQTWRPTNSFTSQAWPDQSHSVYGQGTLVYQSCTRRDPIRL